MKIPKEKVIDLAVDILLGELRPYVSETKDVLANAARDTYESIITGRRTINEWAEIAIGGVDKVKAEVIKEYGWKYVGGKLNFTMSEKVSHKAVISIELYFQDENGNWQKVGAESDMYASNFTMEALEEIKSQGIVSFEVD
ncbi:MAG: hypothetical protein HDR09_10045 [Lachnospiraceae bacterium]|nr:hypothetical protein [Lachnospiraceae bacterium]